MTAVKRSTAVGKRVFQTRWVDCEKDGDFQTRSEGLQPTSITFAESQVARAEPCLVRITNIQVAHEEANPIRVRRPPGSRSAELLQGAFGLAAKIDDRAAAIQLPRKIASVPVTMKASVFYFYFFWHSMDEEVSASR